MRSGKYNAKRIQIDGIWFASTKEGMRYLELKMMQKAGSIRHLKLQPEFVICESVILDGKKCKARKYKADFYYITDDNREVVEDCKGFKTQIYRLKRQLVKALHGIEILET
jgi:hypothetical protein